MANIEEELQGLNKEQLELRFLRTMIWYHSEKRYPTGFFRGLPERADHLLDLLSQFTKQLEQNSKSQARLALALNVFTGMLVLVGVLQIVVPRI